MQSQTFTLYFNIVFDVSSILAVRATYKAFFPHRIISTKKAHIGTVSIERVF